MLEKYDIDEQDIYCDFHKTEHTVTSGVFDELTYDNFIYNLNDWD